MDNSRLVPPGYKRTEIGIIPEDWELALITDHASITTGAKDTQDKVDDGLYPFFVRSPNVERINSYSFDGEAVLTAGDGVGTGKIFHYINGKFDFHQRVYRISNFSKYLDGYFFYLYFSTYFYDRVMSMTAKSSVDSVRMEMIADMMIPLPPLSEQQVIADVLGDVDALIAALDRLIAKKRAIKKGAMQQLLTGKIRLPGFTAEWTVKRLGSLFEVTAGGDFDTSRSSNTQDKIHQYPVYSNAISNNGLHGFCSYSDHQAGSITVTARGTLGVANYRDHDFTAIGRVLALKPKVCVNGFFFSEFINDRIEFAVESTGVPQLTAPQICKYELLVPPLPEQCAIAKVLSDMDAEIAALEARRDKTRALKQGMMQELLTGRTRLV